MSGRNNESRFAAPLMPDDLRNQLMAMGMQQQTQPASYQIPAEIVELPSKGLFYSEGHPLHNCETVEIKFMTTKEEDILTSPSLVEKGIVFDKLIESLLIDKRIDPASLLTGDRNAILYKARISAYGPEYSFGTSCASCSTPQKVEHLFRDIKPKEIDYNNLELEDGFIKTTLPKSGATVHLKFLNGRDEKEISEEQRKRLKSNLPEEQLVLTYRKMIVKVNDNSDLFYIANFVSSMPILDSRYLRKLYSELKPDVDMSFRFECKKCGFVDDGGVVSINGDFFWPSSDYINSVYEKIFYMIQLGNWRFFEAHSIPVTLRNWFFDKLSNFLEQQNPK